LVNLEDPFLNVILQYLMLIYPMMISLELLFIYMKDVWNIERDRNVGDLKFSPISLINLIKPIYNVFYII